MVKGEAGTKACSEWLKRQRRREHFRYSCRFTWIPDFRCNVQELLSFIVIVARPSALVWSELRRQRELHEEKLKKRKQKFLEKRKKAGLDDVSEGGTYSVRSGRSGDIDEGFGVSMMSADITTATWGGSTQPSSTQNDSAVSADESDEENQGAEVTD